MDRFERWPAAFVECGSIALRPVKSGCMINLHSVLTRELSYIPLTHNIPQVATHTLQDDFTFKIGWLFVSDHRIRSPAIPATDPSCVQYKSDAVEIPCSVFERFTDTFSMPPES
jgi:hypothetical protein